MKLKLSKEMTLEDFFETVSNFLNKFPNNSSETFYFDELKIKWMLDGGKLDLVKEDGDEAVFNIEGNLSKQTHDFLSLSESNDKPYMQFDQVTEWMFLKDADFYISPEMEIELEFVGEVKIKDEVYSVFSIEAYCNKHGIKFLKYPYKKYVPKYMLKDLIPESVELKTTAIYPGEKELIECGDLSELEKYVELPIITSVNLPWITEISLDKISPQLQRKSSPVWLHYNYNNPWLGSKSFFNVYNIVDLMEQNELVYLSDEEYKSARFYEYISEYELNYFPQKKSIKDHAIICGYKSGEESRYSDYVVIKPLYAINQILNMYSLMDEDNIEDHSLLCHVRYLYQLKKLINKEDKMQYDHLTPIGYTAKQELVFNNVPTHIKNKMREYIDIKETEMELGHKKRGARQE